MRARTRCSGCSMTRCETTGKRWRELDVQRISHGPITGAEVLTTLTQPIVGQGGARTPALGFPS